MNSKKRKHPNKETVLWYENKIVVLVDEVTIENTDIKHLTQYRRGTSREMTVQVQREEHMCHISLP